MVLTLPYPPSLNSIWRRVGNKTILSAKGREYRGLVAAAVAAQAPGHSMLTDRLRVLIRMHAPDNRRRDVSNVPKAVEDALTLCGVWEDDSLIDDLRIVRCNTFKGGAVVVSVEVMN